eukprot:CAMPEP_0182551866 /NCGR_PEP_ID=MMETSP1323-20130603/46532_1 /TAXON_ID=236787 /ORGANISM="Florenciella parvula, Strain RCC1693" /LENGTH=74 /DNA_ID=CAMNT_0024763517 /DNA_START=6 /DNA_END=227 /DNA_ORIENTATION=+
MSSSRGAGRRMARAVVNLQLAVGGWRWRLDERRLAVHGERQGGGLAAGGERQGGAPGGGWRSSGLTKNEPAVVE